MQQPKPMDQLVERSNERYSSLQVPPANRSASRALALVGLFGILALLLASTLSAEPPVAAPSLEGTYKYQLQLFILGLAWLAVTLERATAPWRTQHDEVRPPVRRSVSETRE